MNCPICDTAVQSQNINIQTDVAHCQHCQHIFRISENLDKGHRGAFDMNNPPKGAWIRNEMSQIVIGATTRSPIAFFLVPFMLVWSGGSLGGIYGTQLETGEFDPFMSLFGIPFVIGSIVFWSFALMAIWGKVELALDKQGGRIFTGLGTIGFTRRFTWDEVSTVREKESTVRYPGSNGGAILLEGKRRISFGSGMSESRRYYLYRGLKRIIAKMQTKETLA